MTYQIIDNGDAAITIIFDEPISEKLSIKIIQLSEQIKNTLSDKFDNIIHGYQSLTLCYHPLAFKEKELREIVESFLNETLTPLIYTPKLIEIPVCYDDEFAPDLGHIASHSGLSKQQVIKTHSKETYLVHMLGFLPGFLYLGGLNPQLSCPRKSTPAIQIAAGSVAIGGDQTGIYPVSSPGGWHIIGRTPVALFTPASEQPFIAQALDKVKFIPISSSEYETLI